jgi:hypothetical protein
MTEQPKDEDRRAAQDRLLGDTSEGAVGERDAEADALRSGVDPDSDAVADGVSSEDLREDTDGAPVGRADADEDARRSGADPSGR